MTRKRRRLYFVLLGLAGIGAGTALVLNGLRDNIQFFFSPTEIAQHHFSSGQRIQIGGLVETGSVKKEGSDVFFTVTDTTKSLPVHYQGLLPDLFREGQGVVAEGHLGHDGVFVANEVLAKHDENYMPKEVADALKKSGHWKEGEALPPAKSVGAPNAAANP